MRALNGGQAGCCWSLDIFGSALVLHRQWAWRPAVDEGVRTPDRGRPRPQRVKIADRVRMSDLDLRPRWLTLQCRQQLRDARPRPVRELERLGTRWVVEYSGVVNSQHPDSDLMAPAESERDPGVAESWFATTQWSVVMTAGRPAYPGLLLREGLRDAIFSPDGRAVATTGGDTVQVWNALTGAALIPVLRHPGSQVLHVVLDARSRLLVTSDSDNCARVWDVQTGEAVTPELNHPGKVTHADFSPDGRSIVTACRDGQARVWDLFPFNVPAEDLAQHALMLSARRVNQTGADLEPLPQAALSNAWHTLRAKHPRLFAPPEGH